MSRGNGISEVMLMMDGDQWCAHYNDFTNLQESPAGFGDTREDAVRELFSTSACGCVKAMWSGMGMPAGLCGEKAYSQPTRGEFQYILWACQMHGGMEIEEAIKHWAAEKADTPN